jgi:hypothetical protein
VAEIRALQAGLAPPENIPLRANCDAVWIKRRRSRHGIIITPDCHLFEMTGGFPDPRASSP